MKYLISIFCILGLLGAACTGKKITLESEHLRISLDDEGKLTGLEDIGSGKDYLDESEPSYLLSLNVSGQLYRPTALHLSEAEGLIQLDFREASATAKIRFGESGTHIRLELAELNTPDSADYVVWGPYHTTIKKTVGETVGVVRDDNFAIGIQALNLKTLGGYPSNPDDTEPAYDIFATNSLVDISDSVKVLYRGQTARLTQSGSLLQAYSRNRHEEKVIPVWNHPQYVVPPYADGGVTGSKIALFGSPPSLTLEHIGKIELAEGLPHPLLNGEWIKTNPQATASYLILSFGEGNFEEALTLTKEAGLKYLYHGGPFETWGHFKLDEKAFPGNWASMRNLVKRAEREGVYLGVHTLSNFITTNDPYVSPKPDSGLAKIGATILMDDIGPEDREISIADPGYFERMEQNNLHTVQIGAELIRYERVSESQPWKLLNCQRGAWGTVASAHAEGANVSRLMDHGYKVFLGDAALSEEIARRIANFCNETGIRQISFDGLEGNWASGMGQYGRQLFVKTWYDHLNPKLQGELINDASNPGHFYWHFFTRMNWGEPWYAGFRESQTQYRLMNQDYFDRNLMPNMLGWFSLSSQTSLMDAEWLLARAAAFDAGFGLATSLEAVEGNGLAKEIIRKIRIWESARLSGAFTEEQKSEMKDIKREFNLEQTGSLQWELREVKTATHTFRNTERQPGEPLFHTVEFEHPFEEQPLQFVATGGQEGQISGLDLELNNFSSLSISADLSGGNILSYTGGDYMVLYDRSWNEKKRIPLDPAKLRIKEGKQQLKVTVHGYPGASLKLELRTLSTPVRLEGQDIDKE